MTDDEHIYDLINSFSEKLPHFPDGRIDYSYSDKAPVITVFISYLGKVLLIKRSDKVLTYRGKWNTVAGYLDELKPIQDKIFQELSEELGIRKRDIKTIHIRESYVFTDKMINKTWIVYPVKVELNQETEIILDWEHTEYRWIYPSEIDKYDTVPNANISLKRALML